MAGAGAIGDGELDGLLAILSGRPLALAVSGGADSMALLHLVARWIGRKGATSDNVLDAPVVVLTVDHGLRIEAAAECRAVCAAAGALGIPARTLRWSAPRPASGVQQAARAARYRLIGEALHEEAAQGGPARALVTAHTLEDQAETVLMRLARGSGIDGLSAMRPVDLVQPEGLPGARAYPILRPLLATSRARLVATLEAAGIGWIDDPSNSDAEYERVRVRQAAAMLAGLGLGADAIARSAGRLGRARDALREVERTAAAAIAIPHDACAVVPLDAFARAPDEIAVRLIGRVLAMMGGAAPSARLSEIESLLGRIRPREGEAPAARLQATLGGCCIDWRATEGLRVWREAGRQGLPTCEIAPGETVEWDRRFRVTLAPGAAAPATVRALGADGPKLLGTAARSHEVPAGALETLPALWRGDILVAVAGLMACPAHSVSFTFMGTEKISRP